MGKETRSQREADRKTDGRVEILHVISYNMAAVRQCEREHMPLIGPTNDRQMLALVAKLASSDAIRSRMCFCCDQIYTDAQRWRRHMMSGASRTGVGSGATSCNEIQMYAVADLHKFFRRDGNGFDATLIPPRHQFELTSAS